MNEDILRKVQIVCAWCGPAFVVFYGLSWCILGHNYPPPDSTYSAADLVNKFYLKYRGDILLGQSLSTCLGMLYLPWTCQLSAMMWKRDKSHILSLRQLTGGVLTPWVLAFCPALLLWCAGMAGSVDPVIVKSVHFMGWYLYDLTYITTHLETTPLL